MLAAAIQLSSGEDEGRNLKRAEELLRQAKAAGAELAVLPEKWPALGSDRVLTASAQPLDGPLLERLRALAAELSLELFAGSIVERRPDGSLANTAVHIDRFGELRATYSKIHMFDVEVDGRTYRESAVITPGGEPVLSEAGPFTVGLSICYDLRFPELYRLLAVGGAELFVVPAAFTYPTTRDHWEVLVRARAIENQCFVVAANQVGDHGAGLRSGGRSMIVDPWGVVLAQAPDRECVILAELDKGQLEKVRQTLPTLANRRPAAYHEPAAPSPRQAAKAVSAP